MVEVLFGFKWFVDSLLGGMIGFGGEESTGASFLRRDGSVWTTDKDGIILASEILAVIGCTPSQRYQELTAKYGTSSYARLDSPVDRDQKARLARVLADQVESHRVGG
ncbi:hypothetical protein A8144_04750 [Mycobacterium leprae 3125609]|nr:hypothetical protein A8144_04750 [Mycobacterium leprae 3125609]OAX70499.1 hypothetical protein A3216_11690 [Mycobacterium leprae 7935681]